MVARRFTIVAVLVAGLYGAPAYGEETVPTAGFDRDAAVDLSRAAIGRRLADYTFKDIYGEPVHLADFRGKPILISLIYTSCSHYCPLTTQTLAAGVEAAQVAIGKDGFTVLTIGFDVRNDRPSRMRSYQRTQGIDMPNWHFLSADTETVLALTEQVGFSYYTSSQGFDHLAQTTLLDGNGRIVRQLYGTELTVPQVVEPLKRLRAGETPALSSFDNFVERIRLFCTLYDPDRDAYRFDWSIFVGIGVGMLSIGLLAAFFIDQLVLHLKARG